MLTGITLMLRLNDTMLDWGLAYVLFGALSDSLAGCSSRSFCTLMFVLLKVLGFGFWELALAFYYWSLSKENFSSSLVSYFGDKSLGATSFIGILRLWLCPI